MMCDDVSVTFSTGCNIIRKIEQVAVDLTQIPHLVLLFMHEKIRTIYYIRPTHKIAPL